jgi:hypothetical protein
MRVKAKIAGERTVPTAGGGFWGVRFRKGEILTIPEAAFHPEVFQSLEPKKKDEPKKDKGE